MRKALSKQTCVPVIGQYKTITLDGQDEGQGYMILESNQAPFSLGLGTVLGEMALPFFLEKHPYLELYTGPKRKILYRKERIMLEFFPITEKGLEKLCKQEG